MLFVSLGCFYLALPRLLVFVHRKCWCYGLCANATSSHVSKCKFPKCTNGYWFSGLQDVKPCPRCKVLIIKQEGTCNHVECKMCGTHFCWMCLQRIDRAGVHFLSTDNSCPMFGDQPTSRCMKIFYWAMALLLAPIGIPVISLLAVPFILIGLPIWFGLEVSVIINENVEYILLFFFGVILGLALVPNQINSRSECLMFWLPRHDLWSQW